MRQVRQHVVARTIGCKARPIVPHKTKDAYCEIASGLHLGVLKVAPVEQSIAFREDPGTHTDQSCLVMGRTMPANETSPCWHHRMEKASGA